MNAFVPAISRLYTRRNELVAEPHFDGNLLRKSATHRSNAVAVRIGSLVAILAASPIGDLAIATTLDSLQEIIT